MRTSVENHRKKPCSENQDEEPLEETILTWKTIERNNFFEQIYVVGIGRNHCVRTSVENLWKKPSCENQRGEPMEETIL